VTPHGFTEDQLVEQPALEVLETLGWEVVSAAEEVFGAGGTLGRETPGEAVLLPRLHAALRGLNPGLPP
jgi:type I restriction enzyme R subunit